MGGRYRIAVLVSTFCLTSYLAVVWMSLARPEAALAQDRAEVYMEPDTLWFDVGTIGQPQTLSFTVHGVSGYMYFTVMRQLYDNEFSHTPPGMTTSPGSVDKVFVTYTPTGYGDDAETYFLNPDFGDPPADAVVCMARGPEPLLHVCPDGSGDHTTIQAAIDAAVDGMEIVLCDGVYTGPGNRALDFLGKSITVRSHGDDPTACVINCQQAANGLDFLSGQYANATLRGIGIVNANPYGMHFWQTHLTTIENCLVRDSVDRGVNCISDCGIDFVDCAFNGNGDGGVFTPEGSYSYTRCDFIGNETTGHGGGLLIQGFTTVVVDDCTFTDNTADGFGGGLAYYPGRHGARDAKRPADLRSPVDVLGCEFRENYATHGGAVYCEWGASLDVSDSIIASNDCLDDKYHAGGLGASGFSIVSLTNTVVADNTCHGIHLRDHSDLIMTGSAVFGNLYAGIQTRGLDTLSVDCNIRLDSSTIAYNAGHGLDIQSLAAPTELDRTLVAFNGDEGLHYIVPPAIPIGCCNIFGNAGGDWIDDLSTFEGVDGSFSADPLFCISAADVFTLAVDSPCLPGNHPDGYACGQIGAYGEECEIPTAVDGIAPPPGPTAALGTARPNPFNPSVEVSFTLAVAQVARLSVHDLTGRRIAVLADGFHGVGSHTVMWDGLDAAGRESPSGLYVVRLEAAAVAETMKLTLVR